MGAALFEHGDNDITITGATGGFDSDTVTLEACLDFSVRDDETSAKARPQDATWQDEVGRESALGHKQTF